MHRSMVVSVTHLALALLGRRPNVALERWRVFKGSEVDIHFKSEKWKFDPSAARCQIAALSKARERPMTITLHGIKACEQS